MILLKFDLHIFSDIISDKPRLGYYVYNRLFSFDKCDVTREDDAFKRFR